jgi:hypothetical protein
MEDMRSYLLCSHNIQPYTLYTGFDHSNYLSLKESEESTHVKCEWLKRKCNETYGCAEPLEHAIHDVAPYYTTMTCCFVFLWIDANEVRKQKIAAIYESSGISANIAG